MNYQLNNNGYPNSNPNQEHVQVPAGEGPRHFAFHPNGKYAYLVTEIGGHVIAYHYDQATGILTEKQMLSTLPDTYNSLVHAAHIAVTDNGRYVLASNRGHNSIAVFKVNESDGTLCCVEITSSEGAFPRHFCFSPDSRYILVTNRLSNEVTVLEFDAETGHIGRVCWREAVPQPSFVGFRTVD